MKKLFILGGLLLLVVLLRCSALKKTTSLKTEESIAADKKTSVQQLKLKTATKETNVVTYNPDGTVYQQANIKEQVEQAKIGRLQSQEKINAKVGSLEKVATPQGFWIMVIAGLVIFGIVFYLRKLR